MLLLIVIGGGLVIYLGWLIGSCAGFTHYLWATGGKTGKVVVFVLAAMLIAFIFWLVMPDPASPPVVQ